ncbi:hypothetical protein SESBI_01366 [Sesbania bispinosa]|nr:hypothetical protein SESBI_01366 [Sesbania bispinosa]
MEPGDSSFHNGQHVNLSSGLFPLQQTNSSANTGVPTSINSGNDGVVPHPAMRDKNVVSITSVTKIMRQILPLNAKISDDAKEMVQQSVSKYISFVTRKAMERCQSECRKIMKVEDLLWGLENLGFSYYIEPLTLYLQRYRQIQNDLQKPREELISTNAEQSMDNNGSFSKPSVGDPQLTLPPPPPTSFGPDFLNDPNTNLEILDSMNLDDFDGIGLDVGYSDNVLTNFDPFAHFNEDGL